MSKVEPFLKIFFYSLGVLEKFEGVREGKASDEVLVPVPMLLVFLLHEAQEGQGKGEGSGQGSDQGREGSQGR